MATALNKNITNQGMEQGDLVTFLSNDLDNTNDLTTAVAALITEVNQLRKTVLYNCFVNPGLVIVSNFDAKNATALYYTNGGTIKTLSANTTFDTGTSKTITTAKWAAFLCSIDSSGNAVVTWTSGGAYTSEALAIAALPAVAATETAIGYVTVLAAGATWTAGTDALAGGTGGTPATTTNYYNHINGNAAQIGAAISTMTNTTALTLSA